MTSLRVQCGEYSVEADVYEGVNREKVLLVLIGWTSSKASSADLVQALVSGTGMSAVIFNYSGHVDGVKPPKYEDIVMETRPAQHFFEVVCVFDWIREQHPDAEISVLGTSYGGYLAALLTQHRQFKNLVLRVPAVYETSEFYKKNKEIHSTDTLRTFRKNTAALAELPQLVTAMQFKGDVLVVTHELDEQVPKETTYAYAAAFAADELLAKGFPHSLRGVEKEEIGKYQHKIVEWINGRQ
jgi:uncharacterized protein